MTHQRHGKWELRMSLINREGPENYHVCLNASDFIIFGDRQVEDIKAPIPGIGPDFEEMVEVLRMKEFRRGTLKQVATQLGGKLADYMEDSEGWHGTDRQERVRNNND